MKKHIELEIAYQKEEKERLINEVDYQLLKWEILSEEANKIRKTIEREFINIMRKLRYEQWKISWINNKI